MPPRSDIQLHLGMTGWQFYRVRYEVSLERIPSSACGSDGSLFHVCDHQSLCFTSLPAQTTHEASLSQKSRLKSSTVRRGEKLNLSFQLLWIQYCMSLIPTDWARCPFSR
ncbi:hypothetical protein HZ326_15020 [Fusarium oxysporum f. sp. albedinis]|nr:hypothetical protein HZ326_15020 [Fusarium oxysporum f. sp. albedinis]